MQQQLTCSQVSALLTYYVENRLNKQLTQDIEYHLSICSECKKKFLKLQKIMDNYSNIAEKISKPETATIDNSEKKDKRYADFRANLSAYIDNELSDEESLRVKKFAISNPSARKDLEDIYNFKKLLHSSFEKTKNDTKEDFSKITLNEILSKNKTNKLDNFYMLMIIFMIIISSALLGLAKFLPI